MSRTRFDIAKKDILSFFEKNPQQVFLRTDIGNILNENRKFWRLAQSTTREKFIDLLLQKTHLKATELHFPNKVITIFSWRNPALEVKLSAIKRGCYLSHYTAVNFHSLTKQIPNVHYLTSELKYSKNEQSVLTQVSIDDAFSKDVRETKNCAEIDGAVVCLLYGKFTNRSGVLDIEKMGISVTNIERTLIDIAVRPNYSGGIYEVLEAYKNAIEIASVNKMTGLFSKMNYIYPYHQSIGFLLQRAGYKEHLYSLFKKFPIKYDFYLHHNMKNKSYSQEWRLYYPKGF